MAHALLQPAILEVVDLVTQYRSIELQIEEIGVARDGLADGRTLEESGIREAFGIIIVAIKKQSGEMLFNPAADVRTEAGDRLVLMGQTRSLQELEYRLGAV